MKKQIIFILAVLSFAMGANAQNFNTPVTVDANGDVGQATQLNIVNGYPAMSYYDVTNQDLKFVRANDANGTSWGTPVTVYSTGSVAQWNCLANVNGYPAICFYDNTNGDLKYVRATNSSGSAWGTVQTLTSSGDVGRNCFMMIVNSYPAICYYDVTNGDLKYIRATDVNGTSWGTPVTVSSTGDVGKWGIMAIVNGNPAISFYDLTNGDLKYVRATDASGASWGTVLTVQSTGDVGQYSNLIVTNGMPAMSYYDVTNGDLKYIRASDVNGSTWGSPVTVVSTGDVGKYSSMPLLFGYPTIVYYDVTNNKVGFVRAMDVNGATWAAPLLPDMNTNNGAYVPNICGVNGYPAISYYDATNGDLKYMQLCNTWTGGTSNAWGTASNWVYGSTPTTIEPIIIPNVTNDPVVSSNVTVGALIINSGGSITLSGTPTFTASSTVTNNGIISIATGTLTLAGALSGSGTISGSSTSDLNITGAVGTLNFTSGARTIQNLTLSSSGTATLGTALDIDPSGVVTVSSGGVLTSNGNLTLKSTSAGTARIAAGSTSGGYISGNVTVEKYIQGGRRAFRFLAHPFSSSIPLTQLTDDIDITGSGGPTNSFDYQPLNPASSFWYNPATGNGSTVNDIGWTAFTSATGLSTNSWDVCEAARILIRGSKGQGIYAGAYTPDAVTLDMTGPLNQGNKTINFTKGANTPFALVGNPFTSAIDLSQTTRSATLGANFIVWNPYQGTKGGYTSAPFTTSYIFPAYGSFVVTMTANSSITFPESCKSSGTANSLLKTTGAMPYQVNLRVEDSTNFWDRLLVIFDDSSKASVDYFDQSKLYNPEVSLYAYSKEDSTLSIDSRAHVDSQVIRLGMYVPYKKWYKLVAADFNMQLGTRLFLHDKYMNVVEEIVPGYEYWFEVNNDTASTGNYRFELNMVGKATKITPPPTKTIKTAAVTITNSLEVKLIPNPASDNVMLHYEGAEGKDINITVTDMLGAKVMVLHDKANKSGNVPMSLKGMSAGMYIVELTNGDKTATQKLIKQ